MLDKVRREGVLQTYRTVKARLEEQSPLGYSSAGVVTQVGELAAGFKVGDRVACGGGDYANHAEIAYVPATLCAAVPDGVGLDEAAFATVGAVALQGVRQSAATVGDKVAVIGLGLVGLLTVQILRAAGCEVVGVDPDAGRCAAARGSARRPSRPAARTGRGQGAGRRDGRPGLRRGHPHRRHQGRWPDRACGACSRATAARSSWSATSACACPGRPSTRRS